MKELTDEVIQAIDNFVGVVQMNYFKTVIKTIIDNKDINLNDIKFKFDGRLVKDTRNLLLFKTDDYDNPILKTINSKLESMGFTVEYGLDNYWNSVWYIYKTEKVTNLSKESRVLIERILASMASLF